MTALLVPRGNEVEQVANTTPYHESAPNYPLETWAALLATIFAGVLGRIDFIDAFNNARWKNVRFRYMDGFASGSNRFDVCEKGNEEN